MRTADPITFREIKAWAELADVQLDPWEVDVLRTLDRIRLKVRYE